MSPLSKSSEHRRPKAPPGKFVEVFESAKQELRGFGRALSAGFWVAQKDLRIEFRRKDLLISGIYFGIIVVLLFAFSFFRGEAPLSAVAAGILWVAQTLAGTLALARVFDAERENDCLFALILSSAPRSGLFLGKYVSAFGLMMVFQAAVTPAVVFFFSLGLDLRQLLMLLLTLALGSAGYAAIGTLVSALLVRVRAREVLLAVAFYPLVLPVLILGVKATGLVLEAPPLSSNGGGLELLLRWLVVFDATFVIASSWIFEALSFE